MRFLKVLFLLVIIPLTFTIWVLSASFKSIGNLLEKLNEKIDDKFYG